MSPTTWRLCISIKLRKLAFVPASFCFFWGGAGGRVAKCQRMNAVESKTQRKSNLFSFCLTYLVTGFGIQGSDQIT